MTSSQLLRAYCIHLLLSELSSFRVRWQLKDVKNAFYSIMHDAVKLSKLQGNQWIFACLNSGQGGTTTVMPALLRTEVHMFPSVDNILVHILSTPVLSTVKEVSTIDDSSYIPITGRKETRRG